MNDTSAFYIGMQFNLFNNGTSYGIILIMCILLIDKFHIKYMHSRMPISLYCNYLNILAFQDNVTGVVALVSLASSQLMHVSHHSSSAQT